MKFNFITEKQLKIEPETEFEKQWIKNNFKSSICLDNPAIWECGVKYERDEFEEKVDYESPYIQMTEIAGCKEDLLK